MNHQDRPSERLVEQRLRNRAMEALETLSQGDTGVRSIGVGEYVNQFFDVIDDDVDPGWREWSCLTAQEVEALDRVRRLLIAACAATPRTCTDDEYIASGWPARVLQPATEAIVLMRAKGRFREDVEEETASET
jgi:hypothetical protein